MLNFNLSKNDIGYLRLLIDIESCDNVKKHKKGNEREESQIKYFIYGNSITDDSKSN
jgi:hypothetical protein